VAVDGPHAHAGTGGDVVPARGGDAVLVVKRTGRVDDPSPRLRDGGCPPVMSCEVVELEAVRDAAQ
jgi:hypothetical protein